MTRSYSSFGAAADEEADSRIYGGIHFRFDSVAGQQIGADVAEYVMGNFLLPRNAATSAPGAIDLIDADRPAEGIGGDGLSDLEPSNFNFNDWTVFGKHDASIMDDQLLRLLA